MKKQSPKMIKKLVYLCSPYSHSDENIMEQRFNQVCKTAGILFNKGFDVFCPIAMSHPIKINSNLSGDWATWSAFDKRMVSLCTNLYVLCIDGWKESVGVSCEIKEALKLKIPITFIDENAKLMN